MKKEKTVFERCATGMIEFVLDPSAQNKVFEGLCRHDPKVKKTGRVRVLEEYVPVKLALGCCYWRRCCEEHRIGDKELGNIFFKQIMRRFESPKSLTVAARFGEGLYAANSHPEEAPALSIMTHFFEKLDLSRVGGETAAAGISPAFLFMMKASEALKNAFEDKFDDFICADEDFRVS